MKRWLLMAAGSAVLVLTTAATCQPIPKSDSATPRVYLLAFRNNGAGGQGAQDTIQPGGSFTVSSGFLGPDKANIRVYGAEDPGITTLVVTGKASGTCSTKMSSSGQVFTAPGRLAASFPNQTLSAPAGQISSFLAADLDALLTNVSCGSHIYANMPQREEFFLDSGTWTIHAEASNCCGGKAVGDFSIVVQ